MSDLSNDRLVVLDEPTLVWAFLASSSTFAGYPRPPARSSNPHADALGVAVHHQQWGLVVTVEQLKHVGDALAATTGLGAPSVARYIVAIRNLTAVSRGGIVAAAGDDPLAEGYPSHVRRAAHAAIWADVDAVVLSDVDEALRTRVMTDLGSDRWVSGPRAFADYAPFIS